MANFGREYYPVDPRDDDKASELAKRQARAQLRADEMLRRQAEAQYLADKEAELMRKLGAKVARERAKIKGRYVTPDEQAVNALLDSMGVRHA